MRPSGMFTWLNKTILISVYFEGADRTRRHVAETIRPVEYADYEALAVFFENNNRPEVTRYFHPFPLNAQTAYKIACTPHLDYYYVAIISSRIVGLFMLRGWDDGFEIPSFGIVVDYRQRGFGLGRKLTEFAIREARKMGCHKIRLSTYASNVNSVRLYMSLGFAEVSRESVLMNEEQDVKIVMTKDLKYEPIR
jgi:[ribosomal protein S18]-alanine N-acetyltransferase